MSFGPRLKELRESKNWSRPRLVIAIRAKCKPDEKPPTVATIKAIELEIVEAPRNGTLSLLCRIFPTLSQIIPKYPVIL